jgi:hypothetical protein
MTKGPYKTITSILPINSCTTGDREFTFFPTVERGQRDFNYCKWIWKCGSSPR